MTRALLAGVLLAALPVAPRVGTAHAGPARLVLCDAADVPVPLTPLQMDRKLAEDARRRDGRTPIERIGGSAPEAPPEGRFEERRTR